MSVYLDASVLVPLLRTEDGSEEAINFVNTIGRPMLVSDFASGEVASAISRLVRMQKIDFAVGLQRLEAYDEWVAGAATPISTEPSDIRLAVQLVRRFGFEVRMPDAIHLAAAQIRGLTLVTLDRRMAMAAESLRLDFLVPA